MSAIRKRNMLRCWACHTLLASFGKRYRRHVHVCDRCLAIARHDAEAIERFRRQENASKADVAYVEMRVRSAIYYAWSRSRRLARA